jgi:hypothetical protein
MSPRRKLQLIDYNKLTAFNVDPGQRIEVPDWISCLADDCFGSAVDYIRLWLRVLQNVTKTMCRALYSGATYSTVHVFWASKMFGGKKSITSALERPKGKKNRAFGLKNPKNCPIFAVCMKKSHSTAKMTCFT